MIKIAALNKELEEESPTEEEVTKEALEQIALQQYTKALELQRKGVLGDATQLLKDLLETELLDGVKKPAPGEKVIGPLFNLKYLCFKNLASMLSASDDVDGAIKAYGAAIDLDDTDITLWYRLGVLCMRAAHYEAALNAFQRGAERNPKHWPCLDKIVTLLMGLDYKEECISTIYIALQLDPGYMRGLVYRKHIYSNFPHIRRYMEHINPIYKWDEKDNVMHENTEKLLKEAELINETFLEQQRAEQFQYTIPVLKLQKPITHLTWESIGESLVHMHHYMTDNYYSHACPIELVLEIEEKCQPMEMCEEVKAAVSEDNKVPETCPDTDKLLETIIPETDQNEPLDKDKLNTTDTEKLESDVEAGTADPNCDNQNGAKKKAPVRRRRSAISLLQQWEWCNKRRSKRKKPISTDNMDNNIYDTLRKMIPLSLVPDAVRQDDEEEKPAASTTINEPEKKDVIPDYFGSELEIKDVNEFINKYVEHKKDIIDILHDYLFILAGKWRDKWPENLSLIFLDANKCYNSHIDVPSCLDDDTQSLLHFTAVNLFVEEFVVNEKLHTKSDDKVVYEPNVVESIKLILTLKPHLFTGTDLLEYTLRILWVTLHIHILNKCEDFALDCLYQLMQEFDAIGDYKETYSIHLVNFTFKQNINQSEICQYIKFLERNKKLALVLDLYERGSYEEVLSIVTDSFEHYKNMTKNQEEMSLDFSAQLSLILDTYWALDKVEMCFKWSLICLHEALTHYFRHTSGSPEYHRWTLTVVKILSCMEHILTTEGLTCIDSASRKELSQGLEDLIRIIGHQVETNSSEMPFGSVAPWVVLHFILQREEDLGRGRPVTDKQTDNSEDISIPLMVLFIAHEQLGSRGWCSISNGKLLYFILDTVVPRLRSPALSKSLENICQYMEQCVYCLFGHPVKKNKLKYLADHNVPSHRLDWKRAQQIYEIYRPPTLPALEGKISGITADTEQLFHRILALLPADCDPQKYVAGIEKYIKGIENKLPMVPPLLPYKMKDIYFLLGDYYFKREEGKMSIKFNILDVIVNKDRFESWAEISLAKAVNLERILNSCKNLNNEKEFLNPAKAIIRCFKRSLELDPTHCNMWIEYGMFVYGVHSFCSRLLKQASESLSMEEFEALEKQKEDMLDTTHKCFMTILNDLNSSIDSDKEEAWLHYYMLGKVAEKRNRPPSEYLNYYMQGVKSLQETDATYPLKINYNSPTHLCIEVLELHYRIHASILKYIEQHENKPIPSSVGKVFSNCIEDWLNGPFSKKLKKDGSTDIESVKTTEPVLAANILKRSISDVGEEDTREVKKQKTEAAAAKIRRSASYDTESLKRNSQVLKPNQNKVPDKKPKETEEVESVNKSEDIKNDIDNKEIVENLTKSSVTETTAPEKDEIEKKNTDTRNEDDRKESCSSSSSSSSSDSSSSGSSSESSSECSRDSGSSAASANDKPLPEHEIMKIVAACLDALEDCASRFPPHYKAIYRIAHYHFYYKKGKDIERCRDLMLSNFVSRAGPKLAGLFSERKHSNFFNNIWKIPLTEVDRAGSFAFHMSRSVLLTMEILKEIDDHKTLLDLSLHLQRIPEPDKKYLRDSDREELAQQAFSLCVQSLKGQLLKFSQQADLKSNDVERQALKSLMLDIYRAYQRAQKQPNSRQFTNLLVDAYKLVCTTPINDTMNLVDLSMKFCQSLIQTLKQQATQASLDRNQTTQRTKTTKANAEPFKTITTIASQSKAEPKTSTPTSTATPVTTTSSNTLPKMSTQDMAAAFQSFLPVMNDIMFSQQKAAALSYLNNISALAGYPPLQNTLQSSLQNSFQAEFYRQFLTQSLANYNLPPPKPKQKRGPKVGSRLGAATGTAGSSKTSKSYHSSAVTTSNSKPPAPSSAADMLKHTATTTNVSSKQTMTTPSGTGLSIQKVSNTTGAGAAKSSGPLAPSMGTVLSTLPPSMSANLTSFGAQPTPTPTAVTTTGKTLQEKLAERQKNSPAASMALNKLPSSLTITKTSQSRQTTITPNTKLAQHQSKPKIKPLHKPKQITNMEVIVLDDD